MYRGVSYFYPEWFISLDRLRRAGYSGAFLPRSPDLPLVLVCAKDHLVESVG